MSHTERAPRRTWPWVIVVVLVVAAIIVAASLISTALATPTAPPTSAAPTNPSTPVADDTASAEPTETPTKKPTGDADSLSDDDIAAIEQSIESNDPTALYDYLSDPVHIEFAASDFNADRTPDNAVTDLDYIDGSSGWTWDVNADDLAAFRAGTYADEFGATALIGESAEGYVISLTVTGPEVTRVFVSKSADLVTKPAQ